MTYTMNDPMDMPLPASYVSERLKKDGFKFTEHQEGMLQANIDSTYLGKFIGEDKIDNKKKTNGKLLFEYIPKSSQLGIDFFVSNKKERVNYLQLSIEKINK